MVFSFSDYERKVYLAVTGKVIGVFSGRPIEGWSYDSIKAKFGYVDHYVAAERNLPLTVIDDDISGALTFIRALADSNLYEKTPCDFFGKTWLNYLIEEKTILWWGGFGVSTEHTAYLRLKDGIPSPKSGSIELNGKTVAEQIGAQIFIDAFGMVAPGNPKLAAELADKAARVSHDGEAVLAAKVVAAMVAEAFISKDMEHLLDTGVSVIPQKSLVARLHRDVRHWCRLDGNWEKTFARIQQKYGYDKFPGYCHVIPNHAVMVMAWSYAQNDFHKAMTIVNTAGWDTDCNAANVGTVCALVAGYKGMTTPYDYISPFADRIFVPTAESSLICADVPLYAQMIAAMGRKIMRLPGKAKITSELDFHHPGSLRGFLLEKGKGFISNENGMLHILGKKNAEFMRPTVILEKNCGKAYLQTGGSSMLYPGMDITVSGVCRKAGKISFVAYYRLPYKDQEPPLVREYPIENLQSGETFQATIHLDVPGNSEILSIGFRFKTQAEICLDSVKLHGTANLECGPEGFSPYTQNAYMVRHWDGGFVSNVKKSICVTGNRFWQSSVLQCNFQVILANRCGLIQRYQGLERFYALVFEQGKARIIKFEYGTETMLAETDCTPIPYQWYPISFQAKGNTLTAVSPELNLHLTAKDSTFKTGACGFYCSLGRTNAKDIRIQAKTSQFYQ